MRKFAGTRLYRSLGVHPRGVILITAMWIIIALSGVVLVLCREMMVESLAAKQHLNQAKADAAEQGMEQYVLSVLEQEIYTPGYKDRTDWEMRRIGDCRAWVVMYNNSDERTPAFGITDEAAKIDLNTATADMMTMLPANLDDQTVHEIIDWRDPDEDVGDDGITGAESPNYENAVSYHAKNAPFESVDELRLLLSLQGQENAPFTELLLHGADKNHNHVLDPIEDQNADPGLGFLTSMVGIEPFVTVYGLRATPLPVANASTENTSSGGSTITTSSTASADTMIADVNSTSNGNSQALTNVLTNYLDQTRASAIATATFPMQQPGQATTTYKNIWDWAVKMQTQAQLTQAEFSSIYLHVMCTIPPASTTSAATQATVINADGTTPATQPTSPVGRVNVNTAPKAVLMCLPNWEEQDADNVIAYRDANLDTTYSTDPTQLPNIAWLMDANQVGIDTQKLVDAGCYLTGVSNVYSAHIVTVSPDGRAFKRVKIVVDVTTGIPQIIYRRDMTKDGWPLDPDIRDKLRKNKGDDIQRIGPIPSVR